MLDIIMMGSKMIESKVGYEFNMVYG